MKQARQIAISILGVSALTLLLTWVFFHVLLAVLAAFPEGVNL